MAVYMNTINRGRGRHRRPFSFRPLFATFWAVIAALMISGAIQAVRNLDGLDMVTSSVVVMMMSLAGSASLLASVATMLDMRTEPR